MMAAQDDNRELVSPSLHELSGADVGGNVCPPVAVIHLARVVTDERPLQKCIKKFYKLAQLRSSGVGGLDREEL
jgi:hypothetical protein